MNKRKWLDKLEPIVEKGPIHFIVVKGMTYYGLFFLATQVITKLLTSDKPISLQHYLLMLGGSMIAGLIFGLMLWPSIERKARHLKQELQSPDNKD